MYVYYILLIIQSELPFTVSNTFDIFVLYRSYSIYIYEIL